MPDKILGIDIQEDKINAVLLKSGIKTGQILNFASIPIQEQEDDEDGFYAAFEELKKSIDISSALPVVSFPADIISFRNMKLPFKDLKKIRQVLPFELEPSLLNPIDEVVIDFFPVEKVEDTSIIAVAVKTEDMSFYWGKLLSFKIEPEIIAIEGVSSAICLKEFYNIPENCIFLILEPKKIIFILISSKKIKLIRPLKLFSQNFNINEVPINIKRTLMLFEEQSKQNFEPEKIYITGSEYNSDYASYLSESLDIPVEEFNFIENNIFKIDKKLKENWKSNLYDKALSLAYLQHIGIKTFNLRQGPFAIKKRWQEFKGEISKTLLCLFLIALAVGTNMYIDMYFLKKKANYYTTHVRNIFSETIPGVAIKDPINQMKEKIDEMKMSFMVPGEKEIAIPAIDSFQSISSLISKDIDVKLDRLDITSDDIQLSGKTNSFNSVDEIKNSLEKSQHFSDVKITSSKTDRKGEGIRFRIKIMYKGDNANKEGDQNEG